MAFAATVIWEVRTTGSDANGGGFDATSGVPGTDFSQQAAAQIAYTDMVIGATTTQFTSAANPPAASLVGNIINITAGTGFTVQRVQVLSVAAGVATCDKSLGTAASTGGTGNMGGCLATPAKAATLVVAGNLTYIKGGVVYTSGTGAVLTASTSGSAGLPICWIGYTTTRSDGGQVTFRVTAANNVCVCSGGFNRFYNIIADANAQGVNAFAALINNVMYWKNCKAMGATNGWNIQVNDTILINCLATTCTTAGFSASSINGAFFKGCRATANTSSGFVNSSCRAFNCHFCISDNNTGASDGFQHGSTLVAAWSNCIAYKNGRDGFRILAGDADNLTMINCIASRNTGRGVSSQTTVWTGFPNFTLNIDYNAFDNNTAGDYLNLSAAPHDVTLTGDPFTNGASNDFSLNNTAGAGAACRAAGFPGILQSGGTGFLDIGALQHADPAGSTPTPVINQTVNVYQ